MNITTKDVARIAGVSQATVSRVINGYHYVSEEKRQKVKKAIEELSYRPNYLARNMVLQKTNVVGLLVPDIMNPFYSEIAKSITDRAQEFNFSVILCNTDNSPKLQDYYIDYLQNIRADGIIIASCQLEEKKSTMLVKEGYPCVFCNRKIKYKKANFVCSDNKYGARIAVKHLVSLGHQRIGYISGPNRISTAADRFSGYVEIMKENNLEIDPKIIRQGEQFEKDYSYCATTELLQLDKPPTAMFVSNDLMALASLEAIQDKGLDVPGDIALVGYDNIVITEHRRIRLTTVAQQKELMGRTAIDTLINIIKHPAENHPIQIALEPKLIVRESCGCITKRSQARISV